MRILIDECVPKRLVREFFGHEVFTVQQLGWFGKKNGELLKLLMENDYHAFVTIDQNFQYQQNLKETKVSIIVLRGASSRYEDLKLLVPSVSRQLMSITPGMIYVIET